MILLCGIPSEPPLALVREALDEMAEPYLLFNQRQFPAMEMSFEIRADGGVTGELRLNGDRHRLEDFSGVYVRLMDDRVLPEVKSEPPDSPARFYCRALHDTLMRWCEIAPARVVNRAAPMGSNSSKPYQAQLIKHYGFEVPESLITNEADLVRDFRRGHKAVIYKSISGVRSIVQRMTDADEERLELIRWCPTQFQEFVEGFNVRVHVIGTDIYATAARTDATDYRYAYRQVGDPAELTAFDLSEELSEKCVNLTKRLGLAFAGIDLKLTPDGRVFCFEVNPCPAYSYYQANTGQPIARGLAKYLVGEGRSLLVN